MIDEMFQVDELQQLCGYGLKICDGLEIRQPTVGDIVKLGESEYFNMVYTLTAIPSDMKAQLDQMGIDWEKIEDFEFFCMLVCSLPLSSTSVLFGDKLDFSQFEIIPLEGTRGCKLVHRSEGVVIDEIRYKAITKYLCDLHGIVKKPQFSGNAYTHKMQLEMAYEDWERQKRKKKQEKSTLKPLISTMVNMPGFKYNLKEVLSIGFKEFMDAVARTQIITSTQALLNGCYTGNVDTKKLNKNELNYMRDIGK